MTTQRRRVYLRLGRLLGPLAVVGLFSYSFFTKRPRARVVVINEQKEVLLLKSVLSNTSRWSLPGGGLDRNEQAVEAARRELREETGINLPVSSFTFVRRIERSELGLGFIAEVFTAQCKKSDLPVVAVNPKEIATIEWFSLDELPQNLSRLAAVAIDESRTESA